MKNKGNKGNKAIKVVITKSKVLGFNNDYMFIGHHTKVEHITSRYVKLLGTLTDIDIVTNKIVIVYLIYREYIKYIISNIIKRG